VAGMGFIPQSSSYTPLPMGRRGTSLNFSEEIFWGSVLMTNTLIYFPGQCKESERNEKAQNIWKRKGKHIIRL